MVGRALTMHADEHIRLTGRRDAGGQVWEHDLTHDRGGRSAGEVHPG